MQCLRFAMSATITVFNVLKEGIMVLKVCNVCKNPCRDSLSHVVEFGLFLRDGFEKSVVTMFIIQF